eukprot:gene7886-10702_t
MDFINSWLTFVAGHANRQLNEGGYFSDVPIMEDTLSRFLVQATIIIAVCRVLSILGFQLGQPRVIFEIVGGIILGPSAMGRSQKYLDTIFPTKTLGFLGLVANIGLVLYLFLVGLELDPALLKSHARNAGGIALVGMAVPFALGVAISHKMFVVLEQSDPEFADVSSVSFFVFIGTAMSITAFPVLARILKEGGLIYTKAGAMVMGAAALNDAVAWCLLILAISIANAGDMRVAGYVFGCMIAFSLGLFIVIRPIFEFVVYKIEALHSPAMSSNLFALTLMLVFMCSWTTALLGVHSIFGAFLFGLIVPRNSHLFKECNERIEELVVTFTLPLYFALSGLKTDVTQIETRQEGAMVVLVCVIATVGKFIGAGGTALLGGMTLRESSVVAVLMNTRGLVELIVLNLGVSAGVLNTRTFSVMVIMCLFTTFLTCPLIELIYPKHMRTLNVDDIKKKANNEVLTDEEALHQPYPEFSNLSKSLSLVMTIDTLQQLEGMIKLLRFFVPQTESSALSVTAIKFIEPTNSKMDEFLGLNEDGKVLLVQEEMTDYAGALLAMEYDPTMKNPELMPLSMFCNAMSCPVSAYRVQGNPDDFPIELKKINALNSGEIVIIPWRKSTYLRTIFWSSLNILNTPIALTAIVEKKTEPVSSTTVKSMSVSVFDFDPSQLSVPKSDGNNGIEMPHRSSLRPTLRRNTLTTKITPSTREVTNILALITGHPMDIAMLQLLLRFGESDNQHIIIIVPQDRKRFDQNHREAFSAFKKQVSDKSNISIKTVNSPSTDLEELFSHAKNEHFDLFICGFVFKPILDDINNNSVTISEQTTTRNRSNTLSVIAASMSASNDNQSSGIPDELIGSTIAHVELGLIGSLMYTHASENIAVTERSVTIIVLHESHIMAQTRNMSKKNNPIIARPVNPLSTIMEKMNRGKNSPGESSQNDLTTLGNLDSIAEGNEGKQ